MGIDWVRVLSPARAGLGNGILIIPLLSDSWLDESESQMKKTLKTKILEIVPAKCDDWKNCDLWHIL